MSKIGLLGDTHGDGNWTVNALRVFHEQGIEKVLQLGDFGIYETLEGFKFSKRVSLAAKKFGISLYVVPGNHEDWNAISEYPVADDGWQHYRENVYLAPRGHRWEWEDRSFVALGGAPSVDRMWRINNAPGTWFPGEAITKEDVQTVIDGGTADVMVTHDAPFGAPGVERAIRGNPFGFNEIDLQYALEGRKLMWEAFREVQPHTFLHGHYHFLHNEMWNVPTSPMFRDIRFKTRMLGLDCNGRNFSLGALDLGSMVSEPWDRGVYHY